MLAINKIQEASTCIYDLAKYEDCTDIVKNELQKAYKLMEEFIRANTKEKKAGRLDMQKFVCKDKFKDNTYSRPAMAGIYHDQVNERAVSSDAYILIASKADYNSEYAGKTVTKKGEIMESTEDRPLRFPKWKDILPSPEALSSKYVTLNKEEFNEKIKAAQVARKLDKSGIFVIKLEFDNQGEKKTMYLNLNYAEMLLNMPGTLYATDGRRTLYYEDDNYQVVICPRCQTDEQIARVF